MTSSKAFSSFFLRLVFLMAAFFVMGTASTSALAQCPSSEKIQAAIQRVFKKDIKVLSIKPSAFPGLCEVQVETGSRKGIVYSDLTGDYLLTGQLLDTRKRVNLTRETMAELNKLPPDQMARLDSLTAFTYGKGDKIVYFVTDPECQYCKIALPMLKNLADQGALTVKVLLYPLAMHREASPQSISIICDKKGIEGLEQGYKSENQCPEGVKKIKETGDFMKEKGISGTPAYVFADGKFHVGLLQENDLRQRLGLLTENAAEQPPAKNAEPKGE